MSLINGLSIYGVDRYITGNAKRLQKQASIAHVVSSQSSHIQAFRERNEYMVDNADIVVAFFDNREQNGNVEKVALSIPFPMGRSN